MQAAASYLYEKLEADLSSLPIEEAVPLTRALGHYLMLTAQAELQHRCRLWHQAQILALGRLWWQLGVTTLGYHRQTLWAASVPPPLMPRLASAQQMHSAQVEHESCCHTESPAFGNSHMV